MVTSSLFPLSDHSRTAFASVVLLPGLAILKHVLMGPILEEFIYRGALLPLVRRYVPLGRALLGTSVLFGLTHFAAGAATMMMATLMALIFAGMAVRSESLWPGLICHMAFNFTAGLIVAPMFGIGDLLATVPPGGSVAESIGLILPVWWLLASLVVAGAAGFILWRELPMRNGIAVPPAPGMTRLAAGSPELEIRR